MISGTSDYELNFDLCHIETISARLINLTRFVLNGSLVQLTVYTAACLAQADQNKQASGILAFRATIQIRRLKLSKALSDTQCKRKQEVRLELKLPWKI